MQTLQHAVSVALDYIVIVVIVEFPVRLAGLNAFLEYGYHGGLDVLCGLSIICRQEHGRDGRLGRGRKTAFRSFVSG
jgi:hypothetical protein